MKKTLLAAALLAGFAGAASAQSSVTLYGIVDVGILSQTLKTGDNDPKGNQTSNQTGMASGQQSGSRWGLKGVEDLGNGLSANFVYESSVSVNSGSSSGFTRQSTLGLVGKSWGSIDLGRRTTPGTVAFSGIDPFGSSFGTSAIDSSMGSAFSRLSNMVMYTSPSMNGFMGSIGYSFDSGANTARMPNSALYADRTSRYGSMTKTRAISIGLRYANGPLLIAGLYDQYMPAAYKTTAANAPDFTDAATVKQWNIGATYDLKVAKLHAAYGQNIDGIIEGSNVISNFTDGGDTNSAGGVLSSKGARTTSWMLGVSAPVGASGKVFASWQQMAPGGTFKTAAVTSTQNVGSIGYTYSMSKRTNLYGYYSYMSNAGMLTGAQSNSLGVGIRHIF
jgi:general bacterial porin, GBP family